MKGARLENDGPPRLQRVLEVLSDDCSRTILSALTEPLTATELAEQCDIPSSTVYRKLDTLTAAGLVEERVTVKPEYGRVSRYELNVQSVLIAVDDDGEFSMTVERPAAANGEPERPFRER
jgi:DNA-binding transcriptional ArsR family regulator